MERTLVTQKFTERGQILSLMDLIQHASNRGYGFPEHAGFEEFDREVNSFSVEDKLYQYNGYIYALDYFKLTKTGSLEVKGNILMAVEGWLSEEFTLDMSTNISREIIVKMTQGGKTHEVNFMHHYHVQQLMGNTGMSENYYVPMSWLLQPMCDVVKNYYRV